MKRLIFSVFLIFSVSMVSSQKTILLEAQKNQLKIENYDKIYSKLYYENAADYLEEEGKPALPYSVKIYLLPPGADSSALRISLLDQSPIDGKHIIFPAQPPVPVDNLEKDRIFVNPDPAVYTSKQIFPSSPYELIVEEIFGYTVCKVKIYPFSYIPSENKILSNKLQVQITSANANKRQLTAKRKESQLRGKIARDYLLSLVENPSDFDHFYKESVLEKSSLPLSNGIIPVANPEFLPDYIIITNEELKSEFKRLADWKTKKGFVTYIKTVEEIYTSYPGMDRQEKIRNFIIESTNRWGRGLFVLLGGDINVIPEREHLTSNTIEYGRKFYAADSYYANMDPANTWNKNNDNIFGDKGDGIITTKDVIIGRIPADTKIKVNSLITKILAYEQANENIDYSYFNNSLMLVAPIALGATPAEDINIATRDLISLYDSYLKSRMNCRFLIDKRYTSYSGNASMCGKIEGLFSHFTRDSFLQNLNGSQIKPHIVYHMDHSGPQSMGASNKTENQAITNFDVDATLRNGKYYQIFMTGGCHPGDFTKDCIAKHFLFKSQNGAVAFLGNTDVGRSGEGPMFTNFIKGVFNNGSNRLGLAYHSIFVSNYRTNWQMHLFGDPEMPVWTAAPKQMNVTTSHVRQSDGSFLLTVTCSGLTSEATICISSAKDLFYYVGEVGNGTRQYTFTPSLSSVGYVTVTSPGYRPFTKSLILNGAKKTGISCTQTILSDPSPGNADGKADAGETPRLGITLKNTTSAPLSGLKAVVTCNNPDIRLSSNTVTWGTLSANATKEGFFSFTVDKEAKERLQSAPDATTFHFELTDSNGDGYHLEDIKIDVYESDLQMELAEISSVPAAGSSLTLKFRVTNSRLGQASGLQATLSGTMITAATRTCGNLKYEKDSIYTFTTKVATNYKSGNLPVTLTLRNQYNREWKETFNLAAAPAALSVATFDYTCDADFIQVFWPHIEGVKGYNVYRSSLNASDQPVGGYRKQNSELLRYPFYSDHRVDEFSAYSYKATVVSKDGIESPLSDAFTASTSLPKVGLFPIRAYQTMKAGSRIDMPVLTEDINGNGKREIFTGVQSYSTWGAMIAVDSEGNDLFDIDNNVTTHSGFAETDQKICAAPAIGPLVKGGEKRLIFAERGEYNPSKLFCYSFEDANGDGKPDLVWEKSILSSSLQSVILTNLDGSSDGSNEIMIRGESNSREGHRNINVFSNTGNLLYAFGEGATYAGLATADLDGNGAMEIVAGYRDGKVQIYRYKGTVYRTLLNIPEKRFDSTPVICDLDNDGQKEILIMGKSGGRAYLYVRKANGGRVAGWNDTSQSVVCADAGSSCRITVGDLNNDGNLEVVVVEENYIRVWKNNGTLWKTINVPGLTSQAAILADVDGEPGCEIVVSLLGTIVAYNLEGRRVRGFPLQTGEDILATPTVADIDNDGINELIAAGRENLFVWKTKGRADQIEWGMSYHNTGNTNEYKCPPMEIRKSTSWSQSSNLCGDLIISSGTLSLNAGCAVTLRTGAMITVERGAILRINGGQIKNADLQVMNGGTVEIVNNGKITLRKDGVFYMHEEAILKHTSGEFFTTP